MLRRTLTIITVVCSVLLIISIEAVAEPDKVEELERRIRKLERLIVELQEKIVALEELLLERQEKGQPLISSGKWMDKNNWRQLEKGMTMEKVKELLGEPDKIFMGPENVVWHYGSDGGYVEFEAAGAKVSGWGEPEL